MYSTKPKFISNGGGELAFTVSTRLRGFAAELTLIMEDFAAAGRESGFTGIK